MAGLRPSGGYGFWNPEAARNKSMEAFLLQGNNSLGNDFSPGVLPRFDWNALAQQQEYQNQLQSMIPTAVPGGQLSASDQATLNNVTSQYNIWNQANGGGGSPRLNALLRALGAQESGNNYGARNPSGAMGRWQVMPSNIAGGGGWDMEALGHNVSTQQFMNSRAIQNAIVRYKFGQYLKKYGAKGALSAWYSGDPNRWKSGGGGGGGYPSVYNYVMQVLNRL